MPRRPAMAVRVWLRKSQGCPLTLARAEPDEPPPPPPLQDSPPLLILTHTQSQHTHCSSLILFSSPLSLGLAPPWAPVPNLQGDYDKNERPPRDGARRDKKERRGWQRERMRRRRRRRGRKGLEMDDVTGNFGCVLWFGIRVSALSTKLYLYCLSAIFK